MPWRAAKACRVVFRLRIEHAAAGDDQRPLGAAQQLHRHRQLRRIGGEAARPRHMGREERLRIVERLGLHILGHAERHRPAFGGIGQHLHRARQRGQQLFRPGDAIPIARHRPEAIIGGDRGIAEILDLLQHRIGPAAGIDIAGQQQQRQPVHMGDGGGRDHVGGARADRAGAGHHLSAPLRLGEGHGGQRHRLLVVGAEGG